MKLKRNMERIMSICLTWFPISGLGEPYLYHNLKDLTRIVDITWRECESYKYSHSQEMIIRDGVSTHHPL